MNLLCVLSMYACMYVCGHICGTAYMWKSEDNFQELVLFFNHVGPGAQTQVARSGSRHLYQRSRLTGLRTLISKAKSEPPLLRKREVAVLGLQHKTKARAEFVSWLKNALL